MALEGYIIQTASRSEIRGFIETWHYSHSINGCLFSYGFKLLDPEGVIVGAAFFGAMAMRNQYKRFSSVESDVIELRRLCCIDFTPRNAESFFIGGMLRWLRKNTALIMVVSYADEDHGHIGTIYKASNFKYDGFRSGGRVILYNGKTYHDKAIRTKYKGELKPFAKRIKEALLSGCAKYVCAKGKHCYTYNLRIRG